MSCCYFHIIIFLKEISGVKLIPNFYTLWFVKVAGLVILELLQSKEKGNKKIFYDELQYTLKEKKKEIYLFLKKIIIVINKFFIYYDQNSRNLSNFHFCF